MKIKEIRYLVPPKDLIYDCLDVFVYLEDEHCDDDFSYFVEITTPEFLSHIMEKFDDGFLSTGYPHILVSELTDQIIYAAVKAYVEDQEGSYWLKLYHIVATLNIQDVNKIIYQKKQESIESSAKTDAEVDAEMNAEQ